MTPRSSAGPGGLWTDVDAEVARERYRALVATLDAGVYHLDPDGHVTAVDDAFAAMTGRTREELVGEHVSRLFAGEDADALARASATSRPSDGEGRTVERLVRVADGDARRCTIRVSPLVEDDAFAGTINVVRPVDAGGETPTDGDAGRAASEGDAGGPATDDDAGQASEDDAERASDSDAGQASGDGETGRPSRSLLADVVDATDGGVVVLDRDREVVWADETVGEYFGVDPATLVGRSNRAVVREVVDASESDPDDVLDRLAVAEGSDRPTPVAFKVAGGEDRQERWLSHRSTPIEEGARAGGRIAVYTDVSEEKRSAGALRESEDRFRSLVDAVEEYAIFRLDPEGTIVSWNAGAADIKGYEAEDVLGEHISTFYTDDDLAAGRPDRLLARATEEGSVEDEGWRLRKDGSRFWASVTITAVHDDDGTHQGFLKVTRDMTDRHRHEEELQSDLQRVLDRISDAFYALDEQWRFTHVNPRAEDLLQRSEEELLGESLWEAFPDAADTVVWDRYHEAMDTQETVSFDLEYDSLDIWVEVTAYPSETGLSVYFQDVTERREYERQLEQSNERLEQFAYAASHDLQEPLRMVSSYLQLIERRYDDVLDDDGREFLTYAVEGADRMRDMIDGLLEYARIESQGNPLAPVALDDVLDDVRGDLRMKIEERDATVTVDPLPRVVGDADQLRQLFQNLLDNAVTYSGDAPPVVHVGARRTDQGHVVSVSDEGVGIDPDDADRVFEVFQRVDATGDGSGIGLALCQRIVERHGGDIRVESTPGEGTTFHVTLPAADDDGDAGGDGEEYGDGDDDGEEVDDE